MNMMATFSIKLLATMIVVRCTLLRISSLHIISFEIVYVCCAANDHYFIAYVASYIALMIISFSGTHIDSPAHFIKGGRTVDQITPEELVRSGNTTPKIIINITVKQCE